MDKRIWLAHNQATLQKRIEWLRNEPEGIIFLKRSGLHSVVVIKERSLIYLLLVELAGTLPDIAQSRMNFNHPLFLVNRHEQAMLLCLLWQNRPDRGCIIGLGGGRLPLVLHHYLPDVELECVDLDPVVIEAATTFFGIQSDRRLGIFLADGRHYLAESNRVYDFIMVDAFADNGCMPYPLTTKEFYQLCRAHLSKEGVLVVNLLFNDTEYVTKIKTIQAVFEQVYVCSMLEGNRVVLATAAPPLLDEAELRRRAVAIQNEHQFSFPFLRRAVELKSNLQLAGTLPKWEEAVILSEDSPPEIP